MKNLEVFELHTAEIFALLYESFPVRVDLFRHQVLKDIAPVANGETVLPPESDRNNYRRYYSSFDDLAQSEEYQQHSEVFPATVNWLEHSGYIRTRRFETVHHFSGVVLTAKGLEMLKCTPSSIDGSLSLGEKLHEEAKKTGSDVMRDLVKQALKEGLKLAVGAQIT